MLASSLCMAIAYRCRVYEQTYSRQVAERVMKTCCYFCLRITNDVTLTAIVVFVWPDV